MSFDKPKTVQLEGPGADASHKLSEQAHASGISAEAAAPQSASENNAQVHDILTGFTIADPKGAARQLEQDVTKAIRGNPEALVTDMKQLGQGQLGSDGINSINSQLSADAAKQKALPDISIYAGNINFPNDGGAITLLADEGQSRNATFLSADSYGGFSATNDDRNFWPKEIVDPLDGGLELYDHFYENATFAAEVAVNNSK